MQSYGLSACTMHWVERSWVVGRGGAVEMGGAVRRAAHWPYISECSFAGISLTMLNCSGGETGVRSAGWRRRKAG